MTDSKEDIKSAKALAAIIRTEPYANKIRNNLRDFVIKQIIPEIMSNLTPHEAALKKIPERKK